MLPKSEGHGTPGAAVQTLCPPGGLCENTVEVLSDRTGKRFLLKYGRNCLGTPMKVMLREWHRKLFSVFTEAPQGHMRERKRAVSCQALHRDGTQIRQPPRYGSISTPCDSRGKGSSNTHCEHS